MTTLFLLIAAAISMATGYLIRCLVEITQGKEHPSDW